MSNNKEDRIAMAKDRCTEPFILETLSRDEDIWVRSLVASNVSTPSKVLEDMAMEDKDSEAHITCRVAENSSTPVYLLNELAIHDKPQVRRRVAQNKATPKDLLSLLVRDQDFLVRSLAEHNLSSR